MVRIVIADDEKWVRAIVKTMILSAQNPDFSIVGEASDGREALDLCTKLSPDVLVTDIKMPEIEGLELIESLRQINPYLKTIIISGYDEFRYAQKAVELGAFSYLLKPIEEEDLINTLVKAGKAVQEEKERKEKETLLRIQHEAGFNLLREKFLNELVSKDDFLTEEIKKQSKRLGIKLSNPVFYVIIISIDDYEVKFKNLSKEQKFAITSKLKSYLDWISKKYFSGYSFFSHMEENEIVIICNTENILENEYIKSKLSCIQKIIKRNTGITFTSGISSHGQGVNRLNTLYLQAAEALKYKMINGKGSIIFYNSLAGMDKNKIAISSDFVNELALDLELLDKKNVNLIIDSVFMQLNSHKASSPHSIKSALWNFILDVINKLDCKEIIMEKMFEFNHECVYEKFKDLETLEDMNVYIKELFLNILNNFIVKKIQCSQNAVETAKNFLDKNYNKKISLEMISNYVFLNPSYFSELFKKETGQNFIEYLTNLRISKAMELMRNTNMKTCEICEAVGYSDPKYFRKLFKKVVGISPSEYKKQA
ncbi:MAG TPA: response regulator [Clostridiaceae bacterium]|nr:response regulator [Clostridiaceae bacterium]